MTVHWYRVKKTYEKPQGGFLAIGPRYPGVLSDDGLNGALHASGRRTVDGGGSSRVSRGGTDCLTARRNSVIPSFAQTARDLANAH